MALLFVVNDFTDNSPLLQMIEKGVNLDHSPRLFFIPSATGFERTPIDLEAWSHRLHFTWGETIAERLEYARGSEDYAESFDGWTFNDADYLPLQFWQMFEYANPPPVALEALRITEHAVDQHLALTDQLGAKLLIIADDGMTANVIDDRVPDRISMENGSVDYVEMFARDRNVPFSRFSSSVSPLKAVGRISTIQLMGIGTQ